MLRVTLKRIVSPAVYCDLRLLFPFKNMTSLIDLKNKTRFRLQNNKKVKNEFPFKNYVISKKLVSRGRITQERNEETLPFNAVSRFLFLLLRSS